MDLIQYIRNKLVKKLDKTDKNINNSRKTKHYIGGKVVTELPSKNTLDTLKVPLSTKKSKVKDNVVDSELDLNEEIYKEVDNFKYEKERYEELVSIDQNILDSSVKKRGRRKSNKQINIEFERLIKNNHSKNTIRSYKQSIRFWNKIASSNEKSIYSLTAPEIEEAVAKYAPRTKNSKIVALKLLSKVYLRNNLFELSIELQRVLIKSKPAKEIVKYINEKDYEKLKLDILEGLVNKDKKYLWLGLFLFCGLRISEVKTIKIQDSQFIKVLGKGNKERVVPSPPYIIKALEEIKAEGYGGWKVSGRNIDKQLRKHGLLKNFHCHQLRHTYATYLYRKGVDLNTLKELLGHETISTTQIYAKSKVDKSILKYL